MTLGVIGKKLGMTQVYDENGLVVPVTVVQVEPLTVTQVKTVDSDGYCAIQVGTVQCKDKCLTKAQIGHLKKTGTWSQKFIPPLPRCELLLRLPAL